MIYPSFLNITVAPSNSGKTQFWLKELAATPGEPIFDRIFVYTFDDDEQYAEEKVSGLPIEVKSYADLNAEEIPRRTFVLMDELNTAVSKYPGVLAQVVSIFTTRAHHREISLVCISQTIFKTPVYSLLRLAHSITVATQSGSNAELLQTLKMFKSVYRNLEAFLLAFQDRPYFITIYISVPYNYAAFNQFVYLRTDLDIRLYFCLVESKNMAKLAPEAEKVLRPLLDKGYSHGLAVVPMKLIELSNEEADSEEAEKDGGKRARSEDYKRLEKNVHEMIQYTVDPTQQRSYLGLWFFVRQEPRFSIDPSTLVISYKDYRMGLQPFLSALMYPSHLHKGKSVGAASSITRDAIALAQVMLSNPAFNPLKIRNKKLRMTAARFKEPVKSPKRVTTKKVVKRLRDKGDERKASVRGNTKKGIKKKKATKRVVKRATSQKDSFSSSFRKTASSKANNSLHSLYAVSSTPSSLFTKASGKGKPSHSSKRAVI